MRFKKITLEGLDVFKKRRVNYLNSEVSGMVEEFDCGSHAIHWDSELPAFGMSKEDFMISSKHTINSLFSLVSSGS